MNDVFQLTPQVMLLPVIHGSGDFAIRVRQLMLETDFDCLAVPLPKSFQSDVEEAIEYLPAPTIVLQHRTPDFQTDFLLEEDEDREDLQTYSYVPIDPCQPVISALRTALGERMPRAFIDVESEDFVAESQPLPDPYALKRVSLERFAAAMLPAVRPPIEELTKNRIRFMADQLRELSLTHRRVLALCSMTEWPWLWEEFRNPGEAPESDEAPAQTEILRPGTSSLMFMLGELPFITSLYERARRELTDDENLSIDGVKELLVEARKSYRADFRGRARRITPHSLTTCLRYVRNLTLLDRRLTPEMYNLVMSAKQVVSDAYALHVLEKANEYEFARETGHTKIDFGVDQLRLPSGDVVPHVSRLPGHPKSWRSLRIKPRPGKADRRKWQTRWNPFSQCSWPPEDKKIEDFRTRVADRAKALMGIELAKTEKFTTSVKDGIDIRDTLRNWHTGDIYVKVLPPSKGRLDSVVMLFDSPADPRDYSWRTTWFAEHQNESTLAFFATNFQEEMIGPGIGLARYGGAMFIFPPIQIPDIWMDPRLDFTETLEERILAAACLHAECRHVALLAPAPPGPGWRRLAKRFGKSLVHLPLSTFSQSTVDQLRIVHVLNGHEVRSYASHFIRKA